MTAKNVADLLQVSLALANRIAELEKRVGYLEGRNSRIDEELRELKKHKHYNLGWAPF